MRITRVHKCFEGLVQHWEHESQQTGTHMRFMSYVPSEKPRACIIWLSDMQSNEETFLMKAGAPRYLADMRIMLLCPDTSPRGLHLPQEHDAPDFGAGASAYVDAVTPGYRNHYRMYSYVSNEIHRIAQETFGMEGRISVMGQGMGGHAALVMALRQTRKFRAVSAFAPYCNPSASLWGQKSFYGYLGDSPELWRMYDALELVKHGYSHPGTLMIDQGAEGENRDLHTEEFLEECKNAGQSVHFREHVGYDNSYYFVGTYIKEHILFHAEYLI